jgi:hypothetical protein
LSKRQFVPAYDIAMIYAALGDADGTFKWLERAIDDSPTMATIQWEPLLDKLRTDPRYNVLVTRLQTPRRLPTG